MINAPLFTSTSAYALTEEAALPPDVSVLFRASKSALTHPCRCGRPEPSEQDMAKDNLTPSSPFLAGERGHLRRFDSAESALLPGARSKPAERFQPTLQPDGGSRPYSGHPRWWIAEGRLPSASRCPRLLATTGGI